VRVAKQVLNIGKLCQVEGTLSEVNLEYRDDGILMLLQVALDLVGPVVVLNPWQVHDVQIRILHDETCGIRECDLYLLDDLHLGLIELVLGGKPSHLLDQIGERGVPVLHILDILANG
jgi:hypothetical protein